MRRGNELLAHCTLLATMALLVLTSVKSVLIVCSGVVRNFNAASSLAGVLKQVDV
jgi:hypothetical protein